MEMRREVQYGKRMFQFFTDDQSQEIHSKKIMEFKLNFNLLG